MLMLTVPFKQMQDTDKENSVERSNSNARILRFNDITSLLLKLCTALHFYGASSQRVEYNLQRASEKYDVKAHIAVLPTLIIANFDVPGGSSQEQAVTRTESFAIRDNQSLDCYKLYKADLLCEQIISTESDASKANSKLDRLMQKPPNYHRAVRLLSYGVCSAAVSGLWYAGRNYDILFSFVVGMIVGLLNWLAEISAPFARISSLVCAFIVSFLANAIQSIMIGTCASAIIFSGIVWLLPGLTITTAVTELATRNMVAGSARILYGILMALLLGIGVVTGQALVVWHQMEAQQCVSLSPYWIFLFFPFAEVSFLILLNAKINQWPTMAASALISYVVAYFSKTFFTVEISSAIAAFAVVMLSNIYSRITKKPSVSIIISGLIILTPGSFAVRGITYFLNSDLMTSLQFGLQMIVIALSIAIGLFLADVLFFPSRKLSTKNF